MSNRTNLKLWRVTEPKLRELSEEDRAVQQYWIDNKNEDKKRDTKLLLSIFAPLFLRYCEIVRDLGKIVDDMVQIQERKFIKRIYDAACARLCELKDSICLVELSQTIYLDNVIIERHLIPYDVKFITPAHLKRDNRDPEMQDLFDKIMQGIRIYKPPVDEEEMEEAEEETLVKEETEKQKKLGRFSMADETDDETDEKNEEIKLMPWENPRLTSEKAAQIKKEWLYNRYVRLIQTCERVRIAMNDVTLKEYKSRIYKLAIKQKHLPPANELVKYVITIQRYWRGYYTRKVLKEEEIERQVIMGMLKKSWKSNKLYDQLEEASHKKNQLSRKYLEKLKTFAEKEEVYIFATRTPTMLEDISDEIIEWMSEWYQRTNWFDAFPEVKDGGTVLIVTGQTKFIEEYLEEKEKIDLQAERYAKDPGAKKKDQEEAKKKRQAEKEIKKELKKKLKEEARARKIDVFPIYDFQITPAFEEMKLSLNDYTNVWTNFPLENNPAQDNYDEFVTEDIYAKLNKQLRPKIEAMLKIEYNLLIAAINKDRRKQRLKALPIPKPPKKKKKGRKRKKKKRLIENREIEELFQELFDNGIIHSYPKVNLDDFISDWNYAAYEYRQAFRIPTPELRDIADSIRTDCILRLGSRTAPRPKGVLITGPPKSGKKLLINAILNETGAVLFDLSPEILSGKYKGKKDTEIFVQMVTKMTQLLQPSVLFVNGAERSVGPAVMNIAKQIKPEDMVMFISCSKQPWVGGRLRKLLKIYQKIILLPRLGYNSCLEFWKRELLPIHGIQRDFDFSSLAKKTINYNIPYLRESLQKILTTQRKCELYLNPLKPTDIYEEIVSGGQLPMNEKNYVPYIRFMSQTPWGKKNARRQAEIQLQLERERKAAEAEEKKKKQRQSKQIKIQR